MNKSAGLIECGLCKVEVPGMPHLQWQVTAVLGYETLADAIRSQQELLRSVAAQLEPVAQAQEQPAPVAQEQPAQEQPAPVAQEQHAPEQPAKAPRSSKRKPAQLEALPLNDSAAPSAEKTPSAPVEAAQASTPKPRAAKPAQAPTVALRIGIVPATMPLEERKDAMPETPASNPLETKYNGVDVPESIRHCTSFEKLFAFCVANTPNVTTMAPSALGRAMLTLRNCSAYLALMHDQEVIARTEAAFSKHWWELYPTQLDASPLPEHIKDLFIEAKSVQDAVLIGLQVFNSPTSAALADALVELVPTCPAVFGAVETAKRAGKKTEPEVIASFKARVNECFADAVMTLEEAGLWGDNGYQPPAQE